MRDDPRRPRTFPSRPADGDVDGAADTVWVRSREIDPGDDQSDDPSGDVTREFWGVEQAWTPRRRDALVRPERPRPQPTSSATPSRTGLAGDLAAALRAFREGIDAFRPRTFDPSRGPGHSRQHGPTDQASQDEASHGVSYVPVAQRSGTDPLLRRAGVATLLTVVLVPLALAARPDAAAPDAGLVRAVPPVTTPATIAVVLDADPVPVAAPDSAATEVAAPAPAAPAPTQAVNDTAEAPAIDDENDADDAPPVAEMTRTESATAGAEAAVDEGAESDESAVRVAAECSQHYTAGAGDSWYRIAEAADITPDELLAANHATLDTVLHPGDRVCLPAGATMPTPPPSTSTPPSTTDAPAPTTTDAPVADDPGEQLDQSEVQALIRATWPADQVDKALAIARRESNYIATADNGWCCVGVFQIYWTVHQGWLDEFGIYERDDLKDARKNIAAAFAMWQRSGWGPWGG